MWEELKGIDNPHLKELAGELQEVVLASKAPATTTKYLGAFNRWKRWAAQFPEIQSFPASPLHISLYIAELKKRANSKSVIEAAVYALRWAHHMAGLQSPTEHPIVQQAVEGARKQLGMPVTKREPITPEILRNLVDKFGSATASLADVRGLCMCLIGYAGFLRHDEIVKLCFSDVKFCDQHVELTIRSSKTDINGRRQCLKEGSLSYTTVRESVRNLLKHVVDDVSVFGVHSLRAGGATMAANSGVQDRQFKRHGRWKSETAKDGYVKDSLDNRLAVSRNLGL